MDWGCFKKKDDPEMDLGKGARTRGEGVGGHRGLCLTVLRCLMQAEVEKGSGGSLVEHWNNLEHWLGKGGHFFFL